VILRDLSADEDANAVLTSKQKSALICLTLKVKDEIVLLQNLKYRSIKQNLGSFFILYVPFLSFVSFFL